jgi:hypothetical protein
MKQSMSIWIYDHLVTEFGEVERLQLAEYSGTCQALHDESEERSTNP